MSDDRNDSRVEAYRARLRPSYPTPEHERAALAITAYFSRQPQIDAVILVNSCARGKAGRDSCLDILVLALPETSAEERAELEKEWERFYAEREVFRDLIAAGKYAEVHLDIGDGVYRSTVSTTPIASFFRPSLFRAERIPSPTTSGYVNR